MGCESCHGPGSLHVQGGGDRSKIVNPRKSPDACFACHTEVRAAFNLPHHHPVLEGKVSCTDCHNPHKGDAVKGGGTSLPQSVKGGGIAMLSANGTCLQCHTAQRGPFVFEHEAVREGCVTCHSPHGSVRPALLNKSPPLLCQQCHTVAGHPSVARTGAGSGHPCDVHRGLYLQEWIARAQHTLGVL
jgi:DmsE family decaheme c-type cytochrome